MKSSKDNYYIRIAEAAAHGSSCPKRQFGAVIVKDDRVVSTGYNGPAKGEPNCCDNGECRCELHGEKCTAVHAEMKAIINCDPIDMKGATIYMAGFENRKPINNPQPCDICRRVIMDAGITRIVTKGNLKYGDSVG